MSQSRIIVNEGPAQAGSRRGFSLGSERGWKTLMGFALLFAAIGALDVALAFYPTEFTSVEWRFSTLAAVSSGLPLLGVGLIGWQVAAIGLADRGAVVSAAIVNAVASVVMLVGMVSFVFTIGPVLVAAPEVRVGLEKAALKSIVFWLLFGTMHGWASLVGFRFARK